MKSKGFTLIELTIYVGIVAGVLIGSINIGWQIIYNNIKFQSFREVQQNARFSMEKISRIIKESSAINNPSPGNSANFLSLKMEDPNLNPTIFDVVNNKLRITQGSGSPYNLTNNRVSVKSFRVNNFSYPNTPGTISLELEIEHINPDNKKEYEAFINMRSTVSLFSGGVTAP